MPFRIPPHIAWPGFVVALLLMSLTAAAITVVAARSDDGAQVIEDYYGKAARWDETAARRAAVSKHGLRVTVDVLPTDEPAALRPIVVSIQDRTGAPVTGLRGTLLLTRPHETAPAATIPLAPAPNAPGTYRQHAPIQASGLWDFTVEAARDTLAFQTTLRKPLK